MPHNEAAELSETSTLPGAAGAMRRTRPRRGWAAQAVVEFAIGSIVFFTLIFGTIDYGRVIFMYSEMQNAVRDGARYGSINPTDSSGIASTVVARAPSLGLTTGAVSSSCNPTTCDSGGTVTVTATLTFQPITQQLLRIGALHLSASASDTVE